MGSVSCQRLSAGREDGLASLLTASELITQHAVSSARPSCLPSRLLLFFSLHFFHTFVSLHFLLFFNSFSPSTTTDSMGRPTWANPEQAAFLKGFVGRLEEEKRNQGLKPFYATVTAEFIKRWASPIPPDVDTTKVTDPTELKELSDKYRERVSRIPPLLFPPLRSHSHNSSKSSTGSRIAVVNTKTLLTNPRLFWISPAKVHGSPFPCNSIRHTPLVTSNRIHRYMKKSMIYGTDMRNRR